MSEPERSRACGIPAVREAVVRRQARLREELVDEGAPLPLDGPHGRALLEELDHARYPELHEGTAPRYGALVLDPGAELWPGALPSPEVLRVDGDGATTLDDARRFADGRRSWLVRAEGAPLRLACFDRTVEQESSLVELERGTGALVVQRTGEGLVRVVTIDGIVAWDRVQWTFTPLAAHYRAPILRLVPEADRRVLDGLLELCVHGLSPAGVGATVGCRAAHQHRGRATDPPCARDPPHLRPSLVVRPARRPRSE